MNRLFLIESLLDPLGERSAVGVQIRGASISVQANQKAPTKQHLREPRPNQGDSREQANQTGA